MNKEYIGKTRNNIDVYWDKQFSHAVTHFAHNQKLFDYTKKSIATINAQEDIIRVEKEMDEIVGTTDLVETNDQDEIIYAKRPLRKYYSRFVKNKSALPTKWITLDMRREGNSYFLYTAFVGRLPPSFPGGEFLPEQSKDFWANHALVWGNQEVVPGTETKECPW